MMVLVATDASALVKYITRFTEECFATLVAVLFIYESVLKIMNIYKQTTYIEYNAVALLLNVANFSVQFECHVRMRPAGEFHAAGQ